MGRRDPRADIIDDDPFKQRPRVARVHARQTNDGTIHFEMNGGASGKINPLLAQFMGLQPNKPAAMHDGRIWHFSDEEKKHLRLATAAFTLALGFMWVGGLGNLLAEIILGGLLHLREHLCRDLLRRELLVAHFHPGIAVVGLDDLVGHHVDVLLGDRIVIAAPDEALDGVQRVGRVGDGLALCGTADQDLAVIRVGDDGRRGALALGVLDDLGVVALEDGDARVGRPEVDPDGP